MKEIDRKAHIRFIKDEYAQAYSFIYSGSTLEGAIRTFTFNKKDYNLKGFMHMCLEMFKDIKRKCSIDIFVIKVIQN